MKELVAGSVTLLSLMIRPIGLAKAEYDINFEPADTLFAQSSVSKGTLNENFQSTLPTLLCSKGTQQFDSTLNLYTLKTPRTFRKYVTSSC